MEQVPERVAGQLQPQVLIGAFAFPLATSELAAVPVQPLQVQHPLSHCAMPALVHPQNAVHALDHTAGSHRPSQHRRNLPIPGQPMGVQLLTQFLLHQMRHVSRAGEGPLDGTSWPLPTQPPESHQGITQFLADRNPRQLTVHAVQEREALWVFKVVANRHPGPTHQLRLG